MIAMNGFLREPATLRRAELAAVERVLGSGWYILGKEVEAFEAEWASTVGVRHAVGVGNGMDAIEISLRALGIGPGDEVITTPMTAFASVLAIIRAGAQPVMADIDPDTHTARLELTLASGPAYRFGALELRGTQRYSPELVRRLAQLPTGADYRPVAFFLYWLNTIMPLALWAAGWITIQALRRYRQAGESLRSIHREVMDKRITAQRVE